MLPDFVTTAQDGSRLSALRTATKKGSIRKYKTCCGGINEDGERKSKKIIKYIC